MASADGIYKLDYNDVLKRHIETGADITIDFAKIWVVTQMFHHMVWLLHIIMERIIDFVEKTA